MRHGQHDHFFQLDDRVDWWGRKGKVIGLSTEPTVTVEFDGGDRLSVGQSTLKIDTGWRDPDICDCGKHYLTKGVRAMSHDEWLRFNAWLESGKPERLSVDASEES